MTKRDENKGSMKGGQPTPPELATVTGSEGAGVGGVALKGGVIMSVHCLLLTAVPSLHEFHSADPLENESL